MQDIKEYLSYDPDTGVFIWIKSPSNNVKAGSIAGGKDFIGYLRFKYKNKSYKAHRLAWYFTYGYFPDYGIDHINEIKTDNRICNLRLANTSQNHQNISSPNSDNTSGYCGVGWCNRVNKWRARIFVKGKRITIGHYNTPEEAYEAYLCAKRELHPFWVEKEVA